MLALRTMMHPGELRPITIMGYRCERCGHEWKPVRETKPRVCPSRKCKSLYWDRPRRS